jgi:hypothetical protein
VGADGERAGHAAARVRRAVWYLARRCEGSSRAAVRDGRGGGGSEDEAAVSAVATKVETEEPG